MHKHTIEPPASPAVAGIASDRALTRRAARLGTIAMLTSAIQR